jgi:hypothetical protein
MWIFMPYVFVTAQPKWMMLVADKFSNQYSYGCKFMITQLT